MKSSKKKRYNTEYKAYCIFWIIQKTVKKTVPTLKINDWANFEKRGYMLDVIRHQIPTMERNSMRIVFKKESIWYPTKII